MDEMNFQIISHDISKCAFYNEWTLCVLNLFSLWITSKSAPKFKFFPNVDFLLLLFKMKVIAIMYPFGPFFQYHDRYYVDLLMFFKLLTTRVASKHIFRSLDKRTWFCLSAAKCGTSRTVFEQFHQLLNCFFSLPFVSSWLRGLRSFIKFFIFYHLMTSISFIVSCYLLTYLVYNSS